MGKWRLMMPNVGVIDLSSDKPGPIEQFFTKLGKDYRDKQDQLEIGNILNQYQQNRNDENALEDAYIQAQTSNKLSPTKRLELMNQIGDMSKIVTERKKALNAQVRKGITSGEERTRQKQNLIKAGWPEYAAENYLDAPPGVRSTMEREHKELIDRGIRKPGEETTPQETSVSQKTSSKSEIPAQEELPIEGEETVQKEKSEWPELPKPPEMTTAERIKWENNNEKVNTKELQDSQKKKNTYQINSFLIDSMGKTSKFLPSGIQKMIVIDPDTGDVRPTAQLAGVLNPETELYIKNLKQFLRGAKDFFGARVTNFDVGAFMAQLPGLITSEKGRELILNQMKYVNELESHYNNTLNDALKQYGRNASLIDIMKVVDDKVAEREPELINRVNNVVEASKFSNIMQKNPEKFKGTILMGKGGRFKAVQPNDVETAKANGWEAY